MSHVWRQKPDTEDLLEQSARLRADLLETVAKLELFVSALNLLFVSALNLDTAEQVCGDDEPGAPR